MINFESDHTNLTVFDCEDAGENSRVCVIAPTTLLEIRGANALQALGGVQTYMRRYFVYDDV